MRKRGPPESKKNNKKDKKLKISSAIEAVMEEEKDIDSDDIWE